MKKLHTFSLADRAEAGLLKELLEKEGVACLIRNEQLFAALGEIPFLECSPELWVVDDEVWPRAKSLLDNWFKKEAFLIGLSNSIAASVRTYCKKGTSAPFLFLPSFLNFR